MNEQTTEVIVSISGNNTGLDAAIAESEAALKAMGNTDVGANSVKTLKQQLKEATVQAQQLQLAGSENTEEYRRAVAAIADLRDQQDQLNRTVSAFDPGNKFNAFVGIAQSAATAVQGYTGALSFLGIASEDAGETLVKLQGIMAFTNALNGIGDLQDYWKGFISSVKAGIGPINATTLATKGLGLAFKALGIGLLVAAVAYLVTNFDSLKKQFSALIPEGVNVGKTFNTLKTVFMGVGNAVLQFLIAPIKAFIALINGEFQQAIDEFVKGGQVIKNYQAGATQERVKQAKDTARELAGIRLAEQEYQLKLLRSGSDAAKKVENEIADLRIKAAENDEDRLKATQDREILFAQRRNKAAEDAEKQADERRKTAADRARATADKTLEERRAALEEIRQAEEQAQQVILNQHDTARDAELGALTRSYHQRLALANKYGKDVTALNEAYAIQLEAINAKYDDAILSAIEDRQNKTLDSYQKQAIEINAFYDNLLKTATDKQRELIEKNRAAELAASDREGNLNTFAVNAQVNLIKTESTNVLSDMDTPEQRTKKVQALGAAELQAENANFQLRKAQLEGQHSELQILHAEHNAKITDIERKQTEASIEIRKRKQKAELDALGVAADALQSFGDLAGEQTVAGKALAVAAATAATYLSAVQSYASASAIPVYGYIAGPIAAAAAVAAGLVNVRKILAVNVPGKSGGGGSVPASTFSGIMPPVTSAQQANGNPIQDVRLTNAGQNPIRAYIVDEDLKDAEDRADFINNLINL